MHDDFALAERASADDPAAKKALVLRISRALSSWAYARVGRHNSDVAVELIWQTSLRVLAGAASQQRQHQQRRALPYRGGDRERDEFDAVLRSIAEAELPRLWRAMHYRNDIARWPLRSIVCKEWLTAPVHHPAHQLRIHFDDYEKRAVVGALARLPPRLREVAHLRYLEGCDFAELVRELRSAPVVVALRLYRATELLVEAKRSSEPNWSGPGERDVSWHDYEQWRWLRHLWPELVRAWRARGRGGTNPPQPLVRMDPAELPDWPNHRRPRNALTLRHGRLRAIRRALNRSV